MEDHLDPLAWKTKRAGEMIIWKIISIPWRSQGEDNMEDRVDLSALKTNEASKRII